jgi:hypothetical protein
MCSFNTPQDYQTSDDFARHSAKETPCSTPETITQLPEI